MVNVNQSSANNLPRVEGLRLIGRVNRCLKPAWRPAFSGVSKNDKPFTIEAHAEAQVQVIAGDLLVALTIQYPGATEIQVTSEQLPTPSRDSIINLPIQRMGAVERGGLVQVTANWEAQL